MIVKASSHDESRPTLRQEQAAVTRKRILDATLALASKGGYDAV